MGFELNAYVIPFLVSTAILIALAIYAYRRKSQVDTARLFSFLMVALAIWTFCYAMELANQTLEGKLFWAKMKYLGSTPGPVLWFVFSARYVKHEKWLTRPLLTGLAVFTVLTIAVVFTNELHHWFWTRIRIEPGFPETQSDHGFYFWIYAAMVYLLTLSSVGLYITFYRTVPAYFRMQALLMVLGGFLPLAVRIPEDFFGLDIVPKLDNVILFLLGSALLFAVALFRYGALDILPIANNLVVQNIQAGIVVIDLLGRIVDLNPFAAGLAGTERQRAVGRPFSEVFSSLPEFGYSPQVMEAHAREFEVRREDRTSFLLAQVSPIWEDRRAVGHVIMVSDITDRKAAELQLQLLARTDALTGVTNRRHFFELVGPEMERRNRYGHAVAIMILDIDHFKKINDEYGHLAGDHVLRSVAQACRAYLRANDVFARYGGEEFICLIPETDQAGAQEIAERIRRSLETALFRYDGREIRATVSIGLTFVPAGSNLSLERIISQADQALYHSKINGRNRLSIWGVLKGGEHAA